MDNCVATTGEAEGSETMTSRERVRTALQHREPDRVPLDIGATESSGMTGMAYGRLRQHLGLKGRTRLFDPWQQAALIEPPVLEALEIDAVPLHFEPRRWKASRLPDGAPCEIPAGWAEVFLPDGSREVRAPDGRLSARMPAGGFYYEPGEPPLATLTELSLLTPEHPAIASFDLPGFSDESWTERARRAKALHKTGRAVVGNLCCHFLAAGQILRGYETFMCDLAAEEDLVRALMEALCAAYEARAARYVAELGKWLDVILVNDDLGTQSGPMIRPETYRRLIKPWQKRFFGHLRAIFPGALLMHSCGAISEFIPDLIECGVQAINPVQISAAGMEPARLKREFGRDIVFWGGGCDTQRTLNQGSPAEVRAAVRRNVAAFSPGGGFVFTQVHNIQPDVPPENVVAMVAALREGY